MAVISQPFLAAVLQRHVEIQRVSVFSLTAGVASSWFLDRLDCDSICKYYLTALCVYQSKSLIYMYAFMSILGCQ